DRAAELRLLDRGEEKELAREVRLLVEEQDAARLRHPLDQEHPRVDRPAGEVADQMRIADAHVLDRHDPLLGLHLQHPVDQQQRVAVRQDRHDPFDVPLRLRFAHWLRRSRSAMRRPSSARRRSGRARAPPRPRPSPIPPAGMPAASPPGSTVGRAAASAATCPPPPRARWPPTPAWPARTTPSPSRLLPAIPAWPQRMAARPTRTL